MVPRRWQSADGALMARVREIVWSVDLEGARVLDQPDAFEVEGLLDAVQIVFTAMTGIPRLRLRGLSRPQRTRRRPGRCRHSLAFGQVVVLLLVNFKDFGIFGHGLLQLVKEVVLTNPPALAFVFGFRPEVDDAVTWFTVPWDCANLGDKAADDTEMAVSRQPSPT